MFKIISTIFTGIELFFASQHICVKLIVISMLFKIALLCFLTYKKWLQVVTATKLYWLLVALLFCATVTESSWLVILLLKGVVSYAFGVIYTRFAWIFFILQYQCIGLLIYYLKARELFFNKRLLPLHIVSSVLMVLMGAVIVGNYDIQDVSQRWALEFALHKIVVIYLIFIFLPYIIYLVFYASAPILVRRHFSLFVFLYAVPQLCADFLHMNPFFKADLITQSYTFAIVSSVMLNALIIFCIRNIMQLRFLNMSEHVEQPVFDNDFKERFQTMLIELGSVTSLREIGSQVRYIMITLFRIPQECIIISVCNQIPTQEGPNVPGAMYAFEHIHGLLYGNTDMYSYFMKHKIGGRHDLEFSTFYDRDEVALAILSVLNLLQIDMIIPMMYEDAVVGYILLKDKPGIEHTLFTRVQKNAAVILASYLGTFVQMLKVSVLINLQTDLHTIKQYSYELEERIKLYYEGMVRLVNQANSKNMGVFFYEKKKLLCLWNNSMNKYATYPSVIAACYTLHAMLGKGGHAERTIVLDAMPFLISMMRSEVGIYVCIEQKTLFDNILFADHATDGSGMQASANFYMRTTRIGFILEDFLPGVHELVTQIKFKLLQASTSYKPIVLYAQKNDIERFAIVIQVLTKKDVYKSIDAKNVAPESVMALLFGVDQWYPGANMTNQERGLIDICNDGVLVIRNPDRLPIDVQKMLARFLQTGSYVAFRGFSLKTSKARVILAYAYEDVFLGTVGSMIFELQEVVGSCALYGPQFELLTDDEKELLIGSFITAFKARNVASYEYEKEVLGLIMKKNPMSLIECKELVEQSMNELEKISIDMVENAASMPIEDIIGYGKGVLKSKPMLTALWHAYDKNQAQIAALLGVNRSSVNRRVKEFNL